MIKGFICEYTQGFAVKNIDPSLRRLISVEKVKFNYATESWESAQFDLPWIDSDYVLLTPTDILTKDDTWINKTDLVEGFDRLPESIPNDQLRAQISNYFKKVLPKHLDKEPTKEEERAAAVETILHFPELIDIYIRYKEETGDQATSESSEKVEFSKQLYVEQFHRLRRLLSLHSDFYKIAGETYVEAHQRMGKKWGHSKLF